MLPCQYKATDAVRQDPVRADISRSSSCRVQSQTRYSTGVAHNHTHPAHLYVQHKECTPGVGNHSRRVCMCQMKNFLTSLQHTCHVCRWTLTIAGCGGDLRRGRDRWRPRCRGGCGSQWHPDRALAGQHPEAFTCGVMRNPVLDVRLMVHVRVTLLPCESPLLYH
jgi:hypothetical protein